MTQHVITLLDSRLPEFDMNRWIAQQKALVFNNDSWHYCMILGTNFLAKIGIKLDYDTGRMQWYTVHCQCVLAKVSPLKIVITWKTFTTFSSNSINIPLRFLMPDINRLTSQMLSITTPSQCTSKGRPSSHPETNEKLFDGSLGVYAHCKVQIELTPNAKPVHLHPYPVCWIHVSTLNVNWTI